MCKFNPKNDSRRIDPCMKKFIDYYNHYGIKTFACCCGHGKYPMTIVVKFDGSYCDVFSLIKIPRQKRFYKKDKQGYYYIPEVNNVI